MKPANSISRFLGAAMLAVALTPQAQAVVPVFAKTDTVFGDTFQSKSYEFAIGAPGTYFATLTDNVAPAMFDYLQLVLTLTGNGTVGSVALGAANSETFSFLASAPGSYTAVVFADPGIATVPARGGGSISVAAGTFGVSITPIPEAETYMMMLSGLAMLGVLAGRRLRRLPT